MQLDEIYDGFADQYDANRGAFDISPILAGFTARLPPRGRLLDLGCGAGEPCGRYFLNRGWQVTGVDFSHRMLQLATRYAPEMTRIFRDMRDVDLAGAEFDAVTAIYSLFHLPVADQWRLFAGISRWLRPGGHLLFTYAGEEYTGQPEFSGHLEFMGRELFYAHTTPQALTAGLAATGLEVIALERHAIGGETFLWVSCRRV